MSGGHFDYVQDRVAGEMAGQWRDEELNELFYDLFQAPLWNNRDGGLATALDLWLSCDIDEEAYREQVAKFKRKWINRSQGQRAEFYAGKLQERCNELKAELMAGADDRLDGEGI